MFLKNIHLYTSGCCVEDGLKRGRETSKEALPHLKGITEVSQSDGPIFQMGKQRPRKHLTKGSHPGASLSQVWMTICQGQRQCGLRNKKKKLKRKIIRFKNQRTAYTHKWKKIFCLHNSLELLFTIFKVLSLWYKASAADLIGLLESTSEHNLMPAFLGTDLFNENCPNAGLWPCPGFGGWWRSPRTGFKCQPCCWVRHTRYQSLWLQCPL